MRRDRQMFPPRQLLRFAARGEAASDLPGEERKKRREAASAEKKTGGKLHFSPAPPPLPQRPPESPDAASARPLRKDV